MQKIKEFKGPENRNYGKLQYIKLKHSGILLNDNNMNCHEFWNF